METSMSPPVGQAARLMLPIMRLSGTSVISLVCPSLARSQRPQAQRHAGACSLPPVRGK
jgi:hypothetical protein